MSDRVLIAGGGVAALEAALALQELAGDRVEVHLYAPREDFVYRPFAVAEPYGASHAMRYPLPTLAERCGAEFHLGSIASVDGSRGLAHTHDGTEVGFDHVVVACGSRLLSGVPGAVTFWGVADDANVRDVVRDLREGRLRRVAFTTPGGGTWALPIYELALLAESELSDAGVEGAELVIVTPEDSPLRLFGRRASERVAELLADRGIEVISATTPIRFGEGRLTLSPSETIEADAVLTLPRIQGRQIGGVPHDADGFVAVDDHGRVRRMSRAYAAGDVTTFPVKQGGIATQQADAAAESIAASIGCEVEALPLDPVLRGVLWTGGKPLYLAGHLFGGHGETSIASEESPWQGDPQDKIIGRHLSPFLAETAAAI
jgi:sulfide:quinone oxidoreductase